MIICSKSLFVHLQSFLIAVIGSIGSAADVIYFKYLSSHYIMACILFFFSFHLKSISMTVCLCSAGKKLPEGVNYLGQIIYHFMSSSILLEYNAPAPPGNFKWFVFQLLLKISEQLKLPGRTLYQRFRKKIAISSKGDIKKSNGQFQSKNTVKLIGIFYPAEHKPP